VRALVLQRRLDLLLRPAAGLLGDVRDRHAGVPVRKLVGSVLRRRLGGRLLLRRGPGAADRLDLDLRELGAEAGMALVALLGAVLADADLLAERGADDPRGHLALRRELELAVAAEHQHLGMEGLALFHGQPVHE
jgi:hypothetical protein